jgi:hypothetical protein
LRAASGAGESSLRQGRHADKREAAKSQFPPTLRQNQRSPDRLRQWGCKLNTQRPDGKNCYLILTTPASGLAQALPLEDDISSVAFWYQTEPHGKFPALPKREAMDVK